MYLMLLSIRCFLFKLNQEFTLEGNVMLATSGDLVNVRRILWWLFGEVGIGFGIEGWLICVQIL